MDGQRFDRLTRALASGRSRRSVLKGLLGAGGAAVVGGVALSESDARIAGTRPTISAPPPPAPTPTPTPTPVDPCPGLSNCAIDGCCDGTCSPQGRCCPAGRIGCGEDCCATQDQCCGGECCPDGSICIGEETCCPSASWCGGVCCTGAGQRCCGDICLQAGQCCIDDDCPDSPDNCQTGVCSNGTCQLSGVCAGSETGSTCCGGTCRECCGTDTSTCSDNKCELFTCNAGVCEAAGIVICIPNPVDRGCFSQICNPGTGQCENDIYFGDGTVCGPSTEGNGSICCNEQCVPSDESNCGSCGNVCSDSQTGSACCNGTCQECCGSDASTCSENECEIYGCADGLCEHIGAVNCQGAAEPCFTRTCNPLLGVCEDEYLGDDTACMLSSGDAGLCCNNECILQDSTNCSSCGAGCQSGQTCFNGSCSACACVIDGQCYAASQKNPENLCQVCEPFRSTSAWSAIFCSGSFEQCAGPVCNPDTGECVYGPWNEGGDCTVFNPADFCSSSTAGTCVNGTCSANPANGGSSCTPPVDEECNPDGIGVCVDGVCKGPSTLNGQTCGISVNQCERNFCVDGLCTGTAPVDGGICTTSNQFQCESVIGTCLNGACNGTVIPCPALPGYCTGQSISCQPELNTCVVTGSPPSSALFIDCNGPDLEPDQSKCCPGHICACPPTQPGQQTCVQHICLWA